MLVTLVLGAAAVLAADRVEPWVRRMDARFLPGERALGDIEARLITVAVLLYAAALAGAVIDGDSGIGLALGAFVGAAWSRLRAGFHAIRNRDGHVDERGGRGDDT